MRSASGVGSEAHLLYVHFDEPMEKNELAKFREYVAKRAKHIPVAQIIGREFMVLDFKVTKDTLFSYHQIQKFL